MLSFMLQYFCPLYTNKQYENITTLNTNVKAYTDDSNHCQTTSAMVFK